MLLMPGCLLSCAGSGQLRERQAGAQATLSEQDDSECRANGSAPGTVAFDECRNRIAAKRAANDALQEKRREAFQRTAGEGSSALSGH
jgi:hypothetical protein